MRVVKAAAVQVSPVLYSREGTDECGMRSSECGIVEDGRSRMEDGGQGECATFPETVVPSRGSPPGTAAMRGGPHNPGLCCLTLSA
jgi:hypothetical protein